MKYLGLFLISLGIGALAYAIWLTTQQSPPTSIVTPLGALLDKPLEKYTIDALSQRTYTGSTIHFTDAVATTSAYTAWNFQFESDGKKVTGLAHVPQEATDTNKVPVIVQIRGFVDRSIYTTGEGTKRSSQVFASNGFITLAPDYLGYGGSDMPTGDVFEERFQTYIVTLNLIASIKSIPMADSGRIGIWGHSNGGHIALTVLEILGQPIPTTLWAPVTKPFPYSILYYTDEFEDFGKALRKNLAKFEDSYDVDLYSMPNYIDRITAPIQLHQGTSDDAIPIEWNNEFVDKLKALDKNVTYFVYPNADHNLMPSWNTVVERDINFFKKQFKAD